MGGLPALGPLVLAAERVTISLDRWYAGVLYFVCLTSSGPLGFTSDNFRDLVNLELDPHLRDYMSNVFAPLGVYLSFWRLALKGGKGGQEQKLTVMMVNDDPGRRTERSQWCWKVPMGCKRIAPRGRQFLEDECLASDFPTGRLLHPGGGAALGRKNLM